MTTIYDFGRNLVVFESFYWGFKECENPAYYFAQALETNSVSIEYLQQKKLVLDFLSEGQDPDFIEPLIDQLTHLGITDIVVMFNTVVDVRHLAYPAISIPTWLCNQGGFFEKLNDIQYDPMVEKKFLCLMRTPTPSRSLISRFLSRIDSARYSFACLNPEPAYYLELDNTWSFRKSEFIDGVVTGMKETDHTNPLFHSCFFNLVVETSAQHDPRRWSSLFITEKTFKAFALRQVPIWFAVPGLVSEIRKLGFDLFDDIVDHSYDHVQDQTLRYKTVFGMIEKFDQQPLSWYQDLRKNLLHRLEYNVSLLRQLTQTRDSMRQTFLEELDDKI